MAKRDFSEYTRLRDIAQKRQKRLVAAGLAEPIKIPTVWDIKSGFVDPGQAMRELQNYLSGGSTVKAVRQTGLVPEFRQFPSAPPKKKRTPEELKELKRLRDRQYRQRKRIIETTGDTEKQKGRINLLKAVATLGRKGFALFGVDVNKMTPSEAADFAEYMEYRFSQGDFTNKYVIDRFVKEYDALKKKGYDTATLKKDFDKFLEDRGQLRSRSDNMEGLTTEELNGLWSEFIGEE